MNNCVQQLHVGTDKYVFMALPTWSSALKFEITMVSVAYY